MLYVLLLLFLNFVSIYCSARPLVIAHRGYSAILPENSLEAFIAAAYVGVDYVEMDIHITKDN
jgi:glycerophosphoryl diester phosphodiesterase